jgi:glycine cleavage system H protein
VKAVSELYLPVSGEIISVNEAIADAPELVNTDPYGDGWMVTVKPSNAGELDALMDKEAYIAMLKG